MEITKLSMIKKEKRNVLAECSILLNDILGISNILLKQNAKGELFIEMPQLNNCEVVFVLDPDFQKQIKEKIIEKYGKLNKEKKAC